MIQVWQGVTEIQTQSLEIKPKGTAKVMSDREVWHQLVGQRSGGVNDRNSDRRGQWWSWGELFWRANTQVECRVWVQTLSRPSWEVELTQNSVMGTAWVHTKPEVTLRINLHFSSSPCFLCTCPSASCNPATLRPCNIATLQPPPPLWSRLGSPDRIFTN